MGLDSILEALTRRFTARTFSAVRKDIYSINFKSIEVDVNRILGKYPVSLKIKFLKVTACRKLSFASLQLPNLRTFCNLYGAFYFFRLTSPTFYFKWFDVVVCFNCFYMATHKATAFDKSNFRQIAKSSSSQIMNLNYFRPCQCLGIDPRWFSAECHVGQT